VGTNRTPVRPNLIRIAGVLPVQTSPNAPLEPTGAEVVKAHNDEVALLETQLALLDEKILQLKKLLPHLKKENWQQEFQSGIMKKRA
jgi:hypothetical protein